MDQIKMVPKMLNSSYRNSSQMKKSTGAFGFTEENEKEMLFDDHFLEGDIETAIMKNQGPKEAKAEIRKQVNDGFDEYTDELLMCRLQKGILQQNDLASLGEEAQPAEHSRHQRSDASHFRDLSTREETETNNKFEINQLNIINLTNNYTSKYTPSNSEYPHEQRHLHYQETPQTYHQVKHFQSENPGMSFRGH